MDRVIAFASVVCLAFVAGGCETTSALTKADNAIEVDPRRGEEVDRICFNRNIDGFSNTEKRSVVLSAGPGKDYLVEVSGICLQLQHAQTIAIDSSLSCVTRGDALIVSESIAGGGPKASERCLISSIYEWDKAANTDGE